MRLPVIPPDRRGTSQFQRRSPSPAPENRKPRFGNKPPTPNRAPGRRFPGTKPKRSAKNLRRRRGCESSRGEVCRPSEGLAVVPDKASRWRPGVLYFGSLRLFSLVSLSVVSWFLPSNSRCNVERTIEGHRDCVDRRPRSKLRQLECAILDRQRIRGSRGVHTGGVRLDRCLRPRGKYG